MIKEAINTLVQGNDLSTGMMEQVMEEIMTNEATDAQKASFLTALSIKGETIDEITVAAKVMSSKCTYFKMIKILLKLLEQVVINLIHLIFQHFLR